MTTTSRVRAVVPLGALATIGLTLGRPAQAAAQRGDAAPVASPAVHHRTVDIDGVRLHVREAGRRDAPAIVLLHGFPTSSYQYRELIPRLADRYRVIAPDHPGFGHSDMPGPGQFRYTFDGLATTMEQLADSLGVES